MMRILVMDDDRGILQAFTAILESADYEVITESNPHNLSKVIKKTSPDLIILDVLLSGADGRDICKKLKAKAETKKIPVIIASAHPSAGASIRASGADDFVEKPFEMDVLLKKVAAQLGDAAD